MSWISKIGGCFLKSGDGKPILTPYISVYSLREPNSTLQLRLDQILYEDDIVDYDLTAYSSTLWCPTFHYTTKVFKRAILEHYSSHTHPGLVEASSYDTKKRVASEWKGREEGSREEKTEQQSSRPVVANEPQSQRRPGKKQKVLSSGSEGQGSGGSA